jgi:hypothetical protein
MGPIRKSLPAFLLYGVFFAPPILAAQSARTEQVNLRPLVGLSGRYLSGPHLFDISNHFNLLVTRGGALISLRHSCVTSSASGTPNCEDSWETVLVEGQAAPEQLALFRTALGAARIGVQRDNCSAGGEFHLTWYGRENRRTQLTISDSYQACSEALASLLNQLFALQAAVESDPASRVVRQRAE